MLKDNFKIYLVQPGFIILSRAIVFYALVFWASTAVIDYNKIKFQVQLRDLNKIFPVSFKYLIELSDQKRQADLDGIKDYVLFYGRVAAYFPDQADAQAMLGFCYDHLGNQKLAIKHYRQAIASQPDYFWPYYNLGIIYFRASQFRESAEMFKKALELNLQKTLELIRDSKVIYKSIILEDPSLGQKMGERLDDSFEYAYQLLILDYYYLDDFRAMLEAARNAAEVRTRKESFYFYAGMAAYELKEFQTAVELFEKAYTINPYFTDAAKYWKLCLELSGQNSSGIPLSSLPKLKSNQPYILSKENLLAAPSSYQDKIFPRVF